MGPIGCTTGKSSFRWCQLVVPLEKVPLDGANCNLLYHWKVPLDGANLLYHWKALVVGANWLYHWKVLVDGTNWLQHSAQRLVGVYNDTTGTTGIALTPADPWVHVYKDEPSLGGGLWDVGLLGVGPVQAPHHLEGVDLPLLAALQDGVVGPASHNWSMETSHCKTCTDPLKPCVLYCTVLYYVTRRSKLHFW